MEQWQKDSIKNLSENLQLLIRFGFVYVGTEQQKDDVIAHLKKINAEYEIVDNWKIHLIV